MIFKIRYSITNLDFIEYLICSFPCKVISKIIEYNLPLIMRFIVEACTCKIYELIKN